MTDQSIIFKADLIGGDDNNSQIRCFVVNQDVSTSLDKLMEKLSTIFTELRGKDFRYWLVVKSVRLQEA